MITDKTQSNAHFLMPKISFSDLKLEDTPSELQHWAVWLIITKFIKQKWTLQECFSKYPKWSQFDPEAQRKTSLMPEVPSKINNFEGLEKVCHKFSQTFLWKRHDIPHQNLDRERSAKYRYSSNMAEHDSSHISSLTILDHAKRSNPHPQPPLFSKHFSNIYLFPDLTILVLTILFRRRFRL